jgi:predicted nuclease of predicted toxin-antitoxin system
MTLRIVIDMNLSPEWVPALTQHGFWAVHWSTVGDPRAADSEIMAWAAENDCLVFSHDLDFSAMLASTKAHGPSVIQIRAQNTLPEHMGALIVAAINQNLTMLERGALVVVNERTHRIRILPIT